MVPIGQGIRGALGELGHGHCRIVLDVEVEGAGFKPVQGPSLIQQGCKNKFEGFSRLSDRVSAEDLTPLLPEFLPRFYRARDCSHPSASITDTPHFPFGPRGYT